MQLLTAAPIYRQCSLTVDVELDSMNFIKFPFVTNTRFPILIDGKAGCRISLYALSIDPSLKIFMTSSAPYRVKSSLVVTLAELACISDFILYSLSTIHISLRDEIFTSSINHFDLHARLYFAYKTSKIVHQCVFHQWKAYAYISKFFLPFLTI